MLYGTTEEGLYEEVYSKEEIEEKPTIYYGIEEPTEEIGKTGDIYVKISN